MLALAVLDIAGTTVDVTDPVPAAFRAAFDAHGMVITDADVGGVRGISKRDAIESLIERGSGEVDAALAGSVLASFRSALLHEYRNRPITPVPGAVDAIRALKARGLTVWLATGFDRELAELVVERSGLVDVVDGLVTDSDVERGRPAPDLIRFAMRGAGVTDAGQVLVAGDTVADLEAAAAAGVACSVAVLSGAHDRALLSGRPHDLILDSVAQLPEELERRGLVPRS